MLGDNIKFLRKAKKLTLEQLADELNKKYPGTINFNKGKLSKWENNKEEPKLSSIRLLADYFNVTVDKLSSESLGVQIDNTQSLEEKINYLFRQLERARQLKVIDFAEKQCNVQNISRVNNVEFKKSDELIEDDGDAGGNSSVAEGSSNYEVDFAAHFVDPNRVYTPEEIDAFKAYLSKAKEDYLKNHD